MSKFKVGDKVRCISIEETKRNFGHNRYMMVEGDLGVIVGAEEDNGYSVHTGKSIEAFCYHKYDLEIILEETVDKPKPSHYYALYNDTTMEIKAISITEDQFLHKSTNSGNIHGFKKVKITVEEY